MTKEGMLKKSMSSIVQSSTTMTRAAACPLRSQSTSSSRPALSSASSVSSISTQTRQHSSSTIAHHYEQLTRVASQPDHTSRMDEDESESVPSFERNESLQDLEEKKHVFDRWDSSSKLFRIKSTPFKPVLEPIEEADE
eukprot:CAMPEP_0184691392 /NCGR_PEP_ID=MMETSP0313-20130426/258_1 /TAXON_ID=2792 /ORGANISM="Porphyridium aerugineum, Strain SAG 1380-2" /LENGTH=138 /DNA_ID=CAMNT_0027149097 /DNA_START=385 /DNA_END=801 /DNA_ORIENTATION=-